MDQPPHLQGEHQLVLAGGTPGPRDTNVQTLQKLKYIKQKLKEWNKEVFGNINQGKKSIEDRMRKLQEQCIEDGYTEDWKKEEIHLTKDWEARCLQEETLW
jgi:hypothetical protein